MLPFAILLGSIIACWRLAQSQELTVMRVAGMSTMQFLYPALVVAFVLGVGNVLLINPLGEMMYNHYEQLESALLAGTNDGRHSFLARKKFWLRDSTAGQQLIVHASCFSLEGVALHMREVSIFIFKGNNDFTERIEAESGTLQNGGFYQLYQTWSTQPGTHPTYSDTLYLPTDMKIEHIQEHLSTPESISIWTLLRFLNFFESSNNTVALGYRLRLQEFLAFPFLLCATVLVASAFVISHQQSRISGIKVLARVAGITICGFLLHFLSKVFYALGQATILPPILATWGPTMITGLLGSITILHFEEGGQ